MIYDQLTNIAQYAGLSPRFAKAVAFIASQDLRALPVGRYAIDGDDVYIMIQQAELHSWESGAWEAHRKFADIQLVVEGMETMGVCKTAAHPVTKAYDESRDVLFLDAAAPGLRLPMTEHDFCVLFPQDAHRPGVLSDAPGASKVSKRAVVKVRL